LDLALFFRVKFSIFPIFDETAMGRAYQNRKDSMAKTAHAKTKVYSKSGREIYVCAKAGGPDPMGNLALRGLIDRAKKDQVPAHVIEKALDKAQGGGGEDFSMARYEGFGPGNCMMIVDCLTDNNNRTVGDVRTCFNKCKAKLGAQGSVGHMFDHRAIFSFRHDDEEAVLEALMEHEVDVATIPIGVTERPLGRERICVSDAVAELLVGEQARNDLDRELPVVGECAPFDDPAPVDRLRVQRLDGVDQHVRESRSRSVHRVRRGLSPHSASKWDSISAVESLR
jgi:transcriptional/translational regulatory protein YebC/TACO1